MGVGSEMGQTNDGARQQLSILLASGSEMIITHF